MNTATQTRNPLNIEYIAPNVIKFPSPSTYPSHHTPTPQSPKNKKQEHKLPVQPLIGSQIQQAIQFFEQRPEKRKGTNIRDLTLFCFAISTGFRVSDLVRLKVSTVLKDNIIVDQIVWKEWKTRDNPNVKPRIVTLSDKIKTMLYTYIQEYIIPQSTIANTNPIDAYLFPPTGNPTKQMVEKNFYRKMKALEVGLGFDKDKPLGCHTTRKTPARKIIDDHPNDPMALITVMNMLNHKSQKTTLHYIGSLQDELANVYRTLDII